MPRPSVSSRSLEAEYGTRVHVPHPRVLKPASVPAMAPIALRGGHNRARENRTMAPVKLLAAPVAALMAFSARCARSDLRARIHRPGV